MTGQLFLPGWLVARMDDGEREHAEQMALSMAITNASVRQVEYHGTVRWIEHDGTWEVRAE